MLFKKTVPQTAAPRPGLTVTAHSGAFDTPDNSLAYIKKALAENCDILEMDVTFRPSGAPVIVHDGSPKETEGVPLEEALALIKAHPCAKMNLDLKSVANLPAVDALLAAHGLTDRAFYTGVGTDWAAAVRKGSAVPYYLNAQAARAEKKDPAGADAFCKRVKALGAIGLNTHYDDMSAVIAAAAHNNGLLVSLWTANNESAMRKCLAMGADNITTRHPDVLRALLRSTALCAVNEK